MVIGTITGPTYDGKIPAPTLVLDPGDTLKIKLINDLPPNPPVTRTGRYPHEPFTTNFHSHGLEVSPEGISDNVLRMMEPGTTNQVEIKLPTYHHPGTFWYHPHHHGAVTFQEMGGMAGMWLGVHAAQRIDRLVLCNTAPRIGSAERWNARIDAVNRGGVGGIADMLLDLWFTPRFRASAADTVQRMRAMLIASSAEGYVASCAAVRDMDQWADLSRIERPTLIVTATHDAVTPPADARRMAEVIPGAKCVELDAAHISNVEAAGRFTAELLAFLDR